MYEDQKTDEILGIVRCVRCGQRLEDEIQCPFCSMFPEPRRKAGIPSWIYLTACFLTSPLSIYFVVTNRRMGIFKKIIVASGCIVWFLLYIRLA